MMGSRMTIKEQIRHILQSRGLTLREVKSPDYTVIEHNGETVGIIYEDGVHIAQNYPSLNVGKSKSYEDTPKTIVMNTRPTSMLEDAIDFLFDSPKRIDRELRVKRLENMKKYFDRKEMEAKIEKSWEEVPGWWNFKPEETL